MSEILFRGKRVDNGEWVYGYYARFKDMHDVKADIIYTGYADVYMGSILPECYDVKPETVGQYTGLKDKNELTKIFEYDIIDANGRKVGNYYENSNLLKDGTCFLVARMGTKEWSRSEQEAIKRGCKYAE